MILHWAIDLRCQELPEVSRNKSTACAEACPTRLWALAGVRGFAFHTAVGRSKDHQSTWWAAWSSVHRSGGHTEPGQASSGPGDTADICIYSPWALTAHWGGTLVKWWNSPRISEPFFSINPVGDPAKSHHNIRAVNVKGKQCSTLLNHYIRAWCCEKLKLHILTARRTVGQFQQQAIYNSVYAPRGYVWIQKYVKPLTQHIATGVRLKWPHQTKKRQRQ